MSQYIVSARKYRPDSFETLIGQDNIARTLKNSIMRGQLAHAYLFCGPRGVGKTSTARIFAKAINCAHPTADMEPCGECESCVSFNEGRSFCIHELDAASNNGVEDIKALMDQVLIPPQVGRYSVYIIDEVHMLSTNAFNAFLKTLEEPPAHAIFILATTEKHKIIPTILSRCQTYDFNRISVPDMVRTLRDIAGKEEVTIDDESLHIIARKADGAMRDALTIFDQTVAFCGKDVKVEEVMKNLNVLDYEYNFSLVNAFLSSDYAKALSTFDEILSKGFNAQYFISALGDHLRDLIVSKTAGLEALLDLPDSLRKAYRAQAELCSLQFLYDALSITTQCDAQYKTSVNKRLSIEFALMKLSFLKNGVPAVAATATAPAPVAAEKPAPVAAEKSAPVAEAPAKAAPAVPEPTVIPDIVVEPMVVPVEKPVEPVSEAPAPRQRSRKGGASISLSALMKDEGAAVGKEEVAEEKVFSAEDALYKWKELAALYPAKPRLANAIANAKVECSQTEDGDPLVTFTVTNESQRGWIAANLLHELEGNFRKITGCPGLRLAVNAAEFEAKKVIYMPEEKARDLMAKNDEVKNLVKDLGLDIR